VAYKLVLVQAKVSTETEEQYQVNTGQDEQQLKLWFHVAGGFHFVFAK
jgi:hypothetical protein